jgi:hypothetical protein
MRDKTVYSYKITSNILDLYVLIFGDIDRIRENKIFWTKLLQVFPELNLLLISP